MDELCRLCAEQSNCLTSVFSCHDGQLISDLITGICPITIDPLEDLPKNICEDCLEVIVSANTLKETSVRSDMNFRLGNNDFQATPTGELAFVVKVEAEALPEVVESRFFAENSQDNSTTNSHTSYAIEHFKPEPEDLWHEMSVDDSQDQALLNQPSGSGFPCPHGCGQIIAHSSNIPRHIRRRHADVYYSNRQIRKSYECDFCQKSFESKSSAALHMERFHMIGGQNRKQQKGKYPCDICNRVFSFSGNLPRHKIRLHSPDLPFPCQVCPDRFNTERLLSKHLGTHDRKDRETHDRKVAESKCKFCEKNFDGNKQRMEIHLLKDHRDQLLEVFECETCQKEFASAQTHQNHLATHKKKVRMQNYSHKCQHCEKRFLTEVGLKTHAQSHSSEKSHFCHICGRLMSSSTALEYHIRRHQVIS